MDAPTDRIVLLDELRRAERHAIVSRLSSVFAHLIGTPLNVIAGRAALIRTNTSAEAVLENALRIEQQVERLAYRIRRLIDYWTLYEAPTRMRDVSAILEDAMALYVPVAAARKVEIVVAKGEVPKLALEGTSTLVLLTNLLALATVVARPESRIEIALNPDGRGALFEFTIPGFEPPNSRIDRLDPPEDDRDRSSAERLQVLSICYAVAEQRGAHLEVRGGERAQVRLHCPAH